MSKPKMKIVHADVQTKTGFYTVIVGVPYNPVEKSRYPGNKMPILIRRAPGGCIIEHEDGTQMDYVGVTGMFSAPVCSVCDDVHPGKTPSECQVETDAEFEAANTPFVGVSTPVLEQVIADAKDWRPKVEGNHAEREEHERELAQMKEELAARGKRLLEVPATGGAP